MARPGHLRAGRDRRAEAAPMTVLSPIGRVIGEAPVAPPPAAATDLAPPDMGRSYDDYFETGLYSRRYPAPNRRVLRLARRLVPAGGRFLDFGAGTGRYCVPLVESTGAACVAFDISTVALAGLAKRHGGLVADRRLALVGPRLADLEAEVAANGRFDLALLAFGVLGHVAGRRQRLALMRGIGDMLTPGGRVLLSVPNALRRFRREQRACAAAVRAGRLEPGDILYRRDADDHAIDLYYHLYRLPEIRRDLADAGFTIDTLTAESVLSEHAVVCHPLVGRCDDVMSGLMPVGFAYGFLAVAHRMGGD
jgi:tRNA (uracil-5-)-methyltransferase TRM9